MVVFNLFKSHRDVPTSIYLWQKFLRNSYNNVGEFVITLLDLLCIIIRSNEACDESSEFAKAYKGKEPFALKKVLLLNLCLTLPCE